MAVNPKPQSLSSPWKDLLEEIDNLLKEPLELHCVGGFVVCYFYGFRRSTGDIDFYTAIPANTNLIDIAGEGTPLAKKHKVWLHRANVMSRRGRHFLSDTSATASCLDHCHDHNNRNRNQNKDNNWKNQAGQQSDLGVETTLGAGCVV